MMSLFMKVTIVLLFAMTIFTGCKKINKFCGVKDPINELSWLKSKVQDTTLVVKAVYKVTYKSIDGFLLDECYNNCAITLGAFYSCNDSAICNFGGSFVNCPDFSSQETYKELIYSK